MLIPTLKEAVPRFRITLKRPATQEELDDQHQREKRQRIEQIIIAEVLAGHEPEDEDIEGWRNLVPGLTPQEIHAADVRELTGLFDQGSFAIIRIQDLPPKMKVFASRMVRREKAGKGKSRLCVENFHTQKPLGGELFAATPSLFTFRLHLALTAQMCQRDEQVALVLWDVTQAFIHAEIPADELVGITMPTDVHNLTIKSKFGVVKLDAYDTVYQLRRALYGYRRSPRLWQDKLVDILQLAGCRRCQKDPSMFVNDTLGLLLTVHTDDFLVSGHNKTVDDFLMKLQTDGLNNREVGRLEKPGDRMMCLARHIERTPMGFTTTLREGLAKKLVDEI